MSNYLYLSNLPDNINKFSLFGVNISPLNQLNGKYAFGKENDVNFETKLQSGVNLPNDKLYFLTRQNCGPRFPSGNLPPSYDPKKVYYGDYVQIGIQDDEKNINYLQCGWSLGNGECQIINNPGTCNENDWQTFQICKNNGKKTRCSADDGPVKYNDPIKFKVGLWNSDHNNALQFSTIDNHIRPAEDGSLFNEYFNNIDTSSKFSTIFGLLNNLGISKYTSSKEEPSSSKEEPIPFHTQLLPIIIISISIILIIYVFIKLSLSKNLKIIKSTFNQK
jgi:hypothetical protein